MKSATQDIKTRHTSRYELLRQLWHALPDPTICPEPWDEAEARDFCEYNNWGVFCGKFIGVELRQSLLGKALYLRTQPSPGYPDAATLQAIFS